MVLVVSDLPGSAQMLIDKLRACRFKARLAATAQSVESAFAERESFAAVLIDPTFEDEDGSVATGIMLYDRFHTEFKNVPTVLLVGNPTFVSDELRAEIGERELKFVDQREFNPSYMLR